MKGIGKMRKEKLVKEVLFYEPERSKEFLMSLPENVLEGMIKIGKLKYGQAVMEELIELGI